MKNARWINRKQAIIQAATNYHRNISQGYSYTIEQACSKILNNREYIKDVEWIGEKGIEMFKKDVEKEIKI